MESSMELGWYESIFEKCSRTPNSYTTGGLFIICSGYIIIRSALLIIFGTYSPGQNC